MTIAFNSHLRIIQNNLENHKNKMIHIFVASCCLTAMTLSPKQHRNKIRVIRSNVEKPLQHLQH